MKSKSISRLFGRQSFQSLALVTAITAFAGSAHATTYVWSGGTSSVWTLAGNWTPSGAAPNNVTAGHRLTVSNAAANPLTYDATLGTTVYGTTGVRALVVGSGTSGAMSITGGTFSSAGSDIQDVIGNGGGTGTLTIAGGSYIGPSLGVISSIGTSMGLAGTGVGVFNINSGSATLSTLTLNASTATVNLNGGTLAFNDIVRLGGNGTINFNGGTLKPRVTSTTFFPNLASTNAFVKSLGAIVNTDGYNVTIGEPLLTDPVSIGGGITKNGAGVLSLGALSTTTGPAVVSAGGLAVVAGATSWAPSSFTHSGDELDFNLGVYSPSNGVPINTATLTLNSSVTVNVAASNLPPIGQVKILDYGTKSGSGSLVAGTLPANATLAENTVDGYYYLDITLAPGTAYTWSAASGDWDSTSLNWNANTVAYAEPALVTFPDLAGGRSINVTADVMPISTTFSNDVGNNYDFSGSAITGTGILIKNGTGTATFANPLTFTGGTYINSGRVQLSDRSLSSDSITIESLAFLTYDNATGLTQGPSSSAGQYLFGAGTLEKKGAGILTLGSSTGPLNWNFSSGALIDVQNGTVICSGSSGANNWASNKASLNIAGPATFDGFEAGVTVDALTGSGIYQGGNSGPRDLKVGVNNGSGTFSGTIRSKPGSAASCVSFSKLGTGEQTLDGSLTINTTTTFGSQTTLLVTGGTLNLNPTVGSVIGSTGNANSGSVNISPGQADLATLTQSSGTLAMNTFGIGNQGRATYSISGGTVNSTQINLAFTGPNTGGGAVSMNVSNTAAVNIHSNGGILMGQYYGRPVTVTQTGGNVVCYSDAGVTKGGTGGLHVNA
jgi:autotransporter-associated beta strand protein